MTRIRVSICPLAVCGSSRDLVNIVMKVNPIQVKEFTLVNYCSYFRNDLNLCLQPIASHYHSMNFLCDVEEDER